MPWIRNLFAILGLIALFLIYSHDKSEAKEIIIGVSIPPQAYLIKEIVGHQDVITLIPSGVDPHIFEPKPALIKKLSMATVFFRIGLEQEEVWISKIKGINPKIIVVDPPGHRGIEIHRDKRGHGHDLDPHTWVSLDKSREIAESMLQALCGIEASECPEYQRRYQALVALLEKFKGDIKTKLNGCPERRAFLVYHPAFSYFAEEFGLEQIAVEKEGKEPKARDFKELIHLIQRKGIRHLIVQPGFPKGPVQALARRNGLRLVEINPLDEGYLKELLRLADTVCGKE